MKRSLPGGRRQRERVTSGKTCLLFKQKGRGQSRIRLPFYDRESFTEVPDEITRKLLIKVNHNGRIPVYLQALARASLLLDPRRRKGSHWPQTTKTAYWALRRRGNEKLDTHAAGFGVWSDLLDLNNLCNRTAVKFKWTTIHLQASPERPEAVGTDPSATVVLLLSANTHTHTHTYTGL